MEPTAESKPHTTGQQSAWSEHDNWAVNGDVRLRWERYEPLSDVARRGDLLLVNGLGSPMVAYPVGFIAELNSRGFDVVRFDNRDAGRSTSTEGGYSLADFATDATVVMDAVGWATAHVFGMSMGGMIVQQLAFDHPDRLQSVTSLMSNTGNRDYGKATDEAMEALMLPSPEERDEWIAHSVKTGRIWASPGQWTEEQSIERVATMFDYGVQPRHVINQWQAIVSSGSREEQLAACTTPMLVMHGTEDTLITPEGGERTAAVAGNARYVALEGMGHDLPPAYWPQLADHLVAFVD